MSFNRDANERKNSAETTLKSSWGFECREGEIKMKYNRNLCRCDGTCILMCTAALIAFVSYVTTPDIAKSSPILLDQDERARLLQMLTHTSRVLSEYNLTHWLDFGSLLGAVRNGRIIDWDDDGKFCWEAES